jgi:HSP20 family molecular chaperone IbpA
MQRPTFELMTDQVRAIYRALTGQDLPLPETPRVPLPPGDADEAVWTRFAELDAWARVLPPVNARVPPFAFSPPIDVLVHDNEVLVEVALPGVARESVQVDLKEDVLTVSGVRAGEKASNGNVYHHAEIARGPFRRGVVLPRAFAGPPRVEVRDGMIRIYLATPPSVAMA